MAGFPSGTDTTYLATNYWDHYANWQHDGAFKGVASGNWGGGFNDQGNWGGLWSASADPDWPDGAFLAYFVPSGVYPADGAVDRYYGFGVRCLFLPCQARSSRQRRARRRGLLTRYRFFAFLPRLRSARGVFHRLSVGCHRGGVFGSGAVK